MLDSYALFAYFDEEEGADRVADLIAHADGDFHLSLSQINLGELFYVSERERGLEEAISRLADLRLLPITFAAVTEERVLGAAHIKATYPVSYADAFAIALAQELGATIVTGDPEFQSVAKIVDVLWLREPTPKKRTPREREAREHRAAYKIGSKRKRRKTAPR